MKPSLKKNAVFLARLGAVVESVNIPRSVKSFVIPAILGEDGLTPLQLETRFRGQNYLD